MYVVPIRCLIRVSFVCLISATILSLLIIFTKRNDFDQPVEYNIERGDVVSGNRTRQYHSSQKGKKEDTTRTLIRLDGDTVLKVQGEKGVKWTEDTRKLLKNELRWKTGRIGTTGGKILIYGAECQLRSFAHIQQDSLHDLILLNDHIMNDTLKRGFTPALASLPCFLYVNKSRIHGAKRGTYSRISLPKGIIFGPYKGEKIRTTDTQSVVRSGYAWALGMTDYDEHLYVEAKNENTSNWLRFINCARFEEEQSLYPIIVETEVYYVLYKDIPANTELLVWYGKGYGGELGLWFLSPVTAPGLAAPRSQVVCPTCRGLPSLEEVQNGSEKGDEEEHNEE